MVEHLFVFKVVGCVSTCVCVSVCACLCVRSQKWLDQFDQLSFMEALNPLNTPSPIEEIWLQDLGRIMKMKYMIYAYKVPSYLFRNIKIIYPFP